MMNWFSKKRVASPARRARLSVEALENRSVPAALSLNGVLDHLPVDGSSAAHPTYVYTESNNPNDGLNAVLAFRRDASTGALTQVGFYATGGTGQLNVPKVIGPDDGDQEVQASADGKFLFAVNEGSGTVAAFRIQSNGALKRIGVYASGGVEPDSIGIAGNYLYVANRGDATQTQTGTIAPNVTAFNLNRDGSLTPIPNSTVSFPVNTFVTQTLVSHDHRFLFVEVAAFPPGSAGTPGGNTVNTFRINADGTLTAAPGGPVAGPNTPILLGAAQNPHYNIVYAGLTSGSQVGVFTYDETGRTSFVTAVGDSGAGPCWCVVSADGRFLYVANTASDSIGVYSLANPLAPVQIEDVKLDGPRSSPAGANTNVFEIALDPTGRYLYAVTQSTDSLNFPEGNQLHTLSVARDGTLTEPSAPVILSATDVGVNAHPQGIVAVQPGREHGHSRWFDVFGDESD
jgi:6-phosphogluconolactonase (cycloisomerase 2 family)